MHSSEIKLYQLNYNHNHTPHQEFPLLTWELNVLINRAQHSDTQPHSRNNPECLLPSNLSMTFALPIAVGHSLEALRMLQAKSSHISVAKGWMMITSIAASWTSEQGV